MTPADIRAAIAADPAMQAMQAAGDHNGIAQTISAQGRKRVTTRLGGIGLVLETLGPTDGAALLDQLDALRATNSAVKWGWLLLERGELDFGSPVTRALLDALCPAPVAAALKATAEVPDTVTTADVDAAITGAN